MVGVRCLMFVVLFYGVCCLLFVVWWLLSVGGMCCCVVGCCRCVLSLRVVVVWCFTFVVVS